MIANIRTTFVLMSKIIFDIYIYMRLNMLIVIKLLIDYQKPNQRYINFSKYYWLKGQYII